MEARKIQEVEAAIEAILFAMGEAVGADRIAAAVGHDADTVRRIARNMMGRYEAEDRGIQIVELDGAFQMRTKASTYEAVARAVHVPKRQALTDVLLETLSIIAYRQPITKMEIEAIRGVRTDHAVNRLVEYDLVCEVGRMDAPGRPILFGTTEEFLRHFGLSSLEELPPLAIEKEEDFRREAEEEAQLTLGV